MCGNLLFFILGLIQLRGYKNILVQKAKNDGTSNIEFIFGKPYAIMTEEDYIKNLKTWYE